MLQRIQTIYLFIFVVLSGIMLSGISILNFEATGNNLQDKIEFKVSSLRIEGGGKMNFSDPQEIEKFSEEIKHLEMSFDAKTQLLSYSGNSPLLIIQIMLTVMALFTMFGYKNLKRQLSLARATLLFTALYVLGVMAMVYFSNAYLGPYLYEIPVEDIAIDRQTTFGFYLVCSLLPFAYLAQVSIKRDYALIKSLDRLR